MKACLILMLLSLTPLACGGSGPEPTLVASTQEQARKLARRHLDAEARYMKAAALQTRFPNTIWRYVPTRTTTRPT